MARARILVVPSWYPSEASPVEGIFIEDQVRVLSSLYDVAVLVPRVAAFRGWWSAADRQGTDIETRDGVTVVRADARSRVPRSTRASLRAEFRAANEGFHRLLGGWGRPDLIHAHVVLPAGWVAAKLGRSHGIPVVLTEHSSPFTMHLGSRWQRARVKESLSGCQAVIAIGEGLAAQIRDMGYQGRVQVIGEVVDVPEPSEIRPLRPPPPPGRTRLAFVGILREQKGVSFLLGALAQLTKGGLDAELVIAGDGPLRGRLEREAIDLGLERRCHFLGLLSRPGVYGLLVVSDLLVVPSLHETFCVAAAEALACGIPVVTTRCGGPEGFVTPECGSTVNPGDAGALAVGIRDVISRPQCFDRAEMRRAILDRFGSAAFRAAINEVYSSVLTETEHRGVGIGSPALAWRG